MSIMLRIVLIAASVLTTILIMRKIRQSKMRIEDSVFWIGFFILLILFSLFPGIVYALAELAGIQAPVNFIFLFVIFVLMVRMFRLTVKLSLLETKVKDLAQKMAIDENLERNGKRAIHAGKEDFAGRENGEGALETAAGGDR